MTKAKSKIEEVDIKSKSELRELEQFYTTNKVDTMFDTIEKKR